LYYFFFYLIARVQSGIINYSLLRSICRRYEAYKSMRVHGSHSLTHWSYQQTIQSIDRTFNKQIVCAIVYPFSTKHISQLKNSFVTEYKQKSENCITFTKFNLNSWDLGGGDDRFPSVSATSTYLAIELCVQFIKAKP